MISIIDEYKRVYNNYDKCLECLEDLLEIGNDKMYIDIIERIGVLLSQLQKGEQ